MALLQRDLNSRSILVFYYGDQIAYTYFELYRLGCVYYVASISFLGAPRVLVSRYYLILYVEFQVKL